MINTNNQPGLSVSWAIQPNLYGVVEYNVTSDQGQTCNTTSSSCNLWPVSCGQVHSVQVVAQNDAGPSVPSSPVVFTTSEYSGQHVGEVITNTLKYKYFIILQTYC